MSSLVQNLKVGSGKLKVVVKDTLDIQGYPTCAASPAFIDAAPAQNHATVVEHILKQDCQIIGKANLHELAFGITGLNPFTGTPVNPKYPNLIPGGSSSGSATAVAENRCDFAIGTDTGGSIRLPATCCGVYGLKPTYARVSRQGVLPTFSSLDSVGPFAGQVDMLSQAMQIICPDFTMQNDEKMTVADFKIAILDVDAEREIWETVYTKIAEYPEIQCDQIKLDHFEEAYDVGMTMMSYENWLAFSDLVHHPKIGADIRHRLLNGAEISEEAYAYANQVRALFSKELDELFEHYDVLILPTLPSKVPTLDEASDPLKLLNLTRFIRPFNVSGHPALSIPLETMQGQPVGMQCVAAKQQDEKLCRFAQCLEQYSKEHSDVGV